MSIKHKSVLKEVEFQQRGNIYTIDQKKISPNLALGFTFGYASIFDFSSQMDIYNLKIHSDYIQKIIINP